ncbi:hypothetical protein DFJ73DRAFT_846385, partial [Zopfochytrium polystomum]
MVRVDAQSLAKHMNKTVHIVGRVANMDMHNRYALLDAADGAQVSIHMNDGTSMEPNAVVEVIGIVNNDLTVQEISSTRFSGDY